MISASIQPVSTAKRILVVDDIADNCFLLQTVLEAEGYQVDVADSGYAALNKIKAAPPNLVLLDVMMPEMNGLEVAQRIRQNLSLPFIPILLITGHTHLTIVEELKAKVEGFIHKPIDFDVLLKQIQILLNRAIAPRFTNTL